jgi:hypothetical protein
MSQPVQKASCGDCAAVSVIGAVSSDTQSEEEEVEKKLRAPLWKRFVAMCQPACSGASGPSIVAPPPRVSRMTSPISALVVNVPSLSGPVGVALLRTRLPSSLPLAASVARTM